MVRTHITPESIARLTSVRYEDLFAQDAETPSLVNVASKAYRRVALYEPGEYEAVLSYNGTTETAYWDVKDMSEVGKTKNVLFYIGDGMTTNMITAARLIAHESKNGRYLSKMAMDKFPVVSSRLRCIAEGDTSDTLFSSATR